MLLTSLSGAHLCPRESRVHASVAHATLKSQGLLLYRLYEFTWPYHKAGSCLFEETWRILSIRISCSLTAMTAEGASTSEWFQINRQKSQSFGVGHPHTLFR